jgi:hypothetical protein
MNHWRKTTERMTMLRPGLYIALLLILVTPVFLAPGLAAQDPANDDIFTISVAAPTSAKDVQVRYFFTGEFGGRGSSVADPIAGNRIVIKTGVEGKSAKSFKLIAYAPGCQLVTLSVDDLGSGSRQGDFQCQKLPTLQLRGRVDILDFAQKDLQVEALYVCRWAMPFFGIAEGSVSPFSLGKAKVSSDGTFTVDVPDFAADPSWPRVSSDAGFMFSLLDAKTGKPLAALSSLADLSRNGGVVPVASSYPELAFTVISK